MPQEQTSHLVISALKYKKFLRENHIRLRHRVQVWCLGKDLGSLLNSVYLQYMVCAHKICLEEAYSLGNDGHVWILYA